MNATINDRTLFEALRHADKVEQELPNIVQVNPSDWDIVILAKELRKYMAKAKGNGCNYIDLKLDVINAQ